MTKPDAVLLSCPFCGGGMTSIRENGKMWTGSRYSEPSSVSVWHHCEPRAGQPSRAIERVGRDLDSAIASWNTRAAISQPAAPVVAPSPAEQPKPAVRDDDTARLDMLESDEMMRVFKIGKTWYWKPAYGQPHRKAKTLREAIDAALSGEQP